MKDELIRLFSEILSLSGFDTPLINDTLNAIDFKDVEEEDIVIEIFDRLCNDDFCFASEWKLEMEDVIFNYNNVAQRLNFPLYEDSQYQGDEIFDKEALMEILKTTQVGAVCIPFGDMSGIFLCNKAHTHQIKNLVLKINELTDFYDTDYQILEL